MSDTSYSNWYREGTISTTKNSDIITGKDSYWLNANIKPGDIFSVDSSHLYEIKTVDSHTQITLKTPYLGENLSGSTYEIIRNFTATLPAEIAAKAASVLEKHERYINTDLKTIQGQSAYEVATSEGYVGTKENWLESLTAYGRAKAHGYTGSESEWLDTLTAYGQAVKNGYTGTAAEWLEDLKAAGEWTKLNARTLFLDDDTLFNSITRTVWWEYDTKLGALHNSIYRGKNLHAFTEDHWQAIHDGTFKDIYLGDLVNYAGKRWEVAGFDMLTRCAMFPKEETTLTERNILGADPQTWNTDQWDSAAGALTVPGGHSVVLWCGMEPSYYNDKDENYKFDTKTEAQWRAEKTFDNTIYGLNPARVNEDGCIYKLKKRLYQELGREHLAWHGVTIPTAWETTNEETGEGYPSAFTDTLTFGEMTLLENVGCPHPALFEPYYTFMVNGFFYRRMGLNSKFPLFNFKSPNFDFNHKCREQSRTKNWDGGDGFAVALFGYPGNAYPSTVDSFTSFYIIVRA